MPAAVKSCLALLVLSPVLARADDRVEVGALAARPIAAGVTGIGVAAQARWDRRVVPWLEVGAGIEGGLSNDLQRVAFLPGIAVVAKWSTLEVRIEERGGWQIVHGKLTLDAIPLEGTETRSFHDEVAVGVSAAVNASSELRGRAGVAIDGIYPAGHSSLRVGPFIGVAWATRL